MLEKKITKKTPVKTKVAKSEKTIKKVPVVEEKVTIRKDALGKIISVKGVVVEVAFD